MFHDTPVKQFVVLADELHVYTDEFSVSPDEKMLPARIVVSGICEIFRNDDRVDAFEIESDSVEVFELSSSIEGVELMLIWHHWNPKSSDVFASYMFPGAKVRIGALTGGPPILERFML